MTVPTRGETFTKIIHHLDELSAQCANMSHLHNTEDSAKDLALARSWLMVVEMLRRFRASVIDLAQGRMQ